MAVRDDRSLASDSPYQNQTQGGQHPGHSYERNPHPTQPRNDPRSNQDQVNKPHPSPYQSQPQVRPAPSAEPSVRTTRPLIQPQVHREAIPPPKHGNGYPEQRSNQDQVNEPYLPPYPTQPQGVRPPSSELPPRTAGYNKHNPPSFQPYVNQQADVSPPKHVPKPRPNQSQANGHYSFPQEREEGGYDSSNGVGRQQPPNEAKMYGDRQKPQEKNRLDCYTNPTPQEKEVSSHGRGNYQSDQFNVHEHNPPSGKVKPYIPATVSVGGYPASRVTASVNPQMHTQDRPYPDPSTKAPGFSDPNKSRFSANKPREVPPDAIPPAGPAGDHGTRRGHPNEQSIPHKGDERSPVSPADRQPVHLTVNVNLGQPAGQASVNGSAGRASVNGPSKPVERPKRSSSGCCSIL